MGPLQNTPLGYHVKQAHTRRCLRTTPKGDVSSPYPKDIRGTHALQHYSSPQRDTHAIVCALPKACTTSSNCLKVQLLEHSQLAHARHLANVSQHLHRHRQQHDSNSTSAGSTSRLRNMNGVAGVTLHEPINCTLKLGAQMLTWLVAAASTPLP